MMYTLIIGILAFAAGCTIGWEFASDQQTVKLEKAIQQADDIGAVEIIETLDPERLKQ